MPNSQPLITDEVEVIMTPIALKFLSEALKANVAVIEKQIGEIALPKELAEQLAQQVDALK